LPGLTRCILFSVFSSAAAAIAVSAARLCLLLLPTHSCVAGSSAEGSKARTLAAEREKQAELFKSRQEDIKKQNQVRLTDMSQSQHNLSAFDRVRLTKRWHCSS